MDLDPDLIARLGCVAIAVPGLLVLVSSMVRFEQHGSGRILTLVLGVALLSGSVLAAIATSSSA